MSRSDKGMVGTITKRDGFRLYSSGSMHFVGIPLPSPVLCCEPNSVMWSRNSKSTSEGSIYSRRSGYTDSKIARYDASGQYCNDFYLFSNCSHGPFG